MKAEKSRKLALLLICIMTITTAACGTGDTTRNLSADITTSSMCGVGVEDLETDLPGVADFYVRLFQNSLRIAEERVNAENETASSNASRSEDSEVTGENILISPLSVIIALAMTANGAEEETLAQMEEVLGMDVDMLNEWLYTYRLSLPDGTGYHLYPANSIWFANRDSFNVNQDFLRYNKEYYDADIYKAPFDESTKNEINHWVDKKTDGMIPEILDEIPEDAVMYLINALAFDAKWQSVYEPKYVQAYGFTREDGENCLVDMMFSEERFYLEDDQAVGFIKPYADGKYAFAALLPNEGISVADYVASLDGAHLIKMLSEAEETQVWAGLPAFETEYDVEMSDILKSMGMTDAFNSEAADFDSLGTSTKGNIYINRVLHKAYICVDE